MVRLSSKVTLRVAERSALRIDGRELAELVQDLERILDAAGALPEFPLPSSPCHDPSSGTMEREDTSRSWERPEQLTAAVPHMRNGFVAVPSTGSRPQPSTAVD